MAAVPPTPTNANLWQHLQFWFNQDTRLSLPHALVWDRDKGCYTYVDFTGTPLYPWPRPQPAVNFLPATELLTLPAHGASN